MSLTASIRLQTSLDAFGQEGDSHVFPSLGPVYQEELLVKLVKPQPYGGIEFVLEERDYTDSGVDWFAYFTESGESIKGPSVRAFPAQLRMA
jgi:hypothetical protein